MINRLHWAVILTLDWYMVLASAQLARQRSTLQSTVGAPLLGGGGRPHLLQLETVSMDNISGDGSMPVEKPDLSLRERHELIRHHAHAYIKLGWAVLMIQPERDGKKHPTKNCPRCDWDDPRYVKHDRETCECISCHGFYAATKDAQRFDRFLAKIPLGHLAIRTGRASRLLVVDAESYAQPGEDTGIETLEKWPSIVGGWDLPPTLTARSIRGGIHLFYELPEDSPKITSGRKLDGIDVKAESGYVAAVSGISNRSWVDVNVPIAPAPQDMIAWLTVTKNRGHKSKGTTGGGNVHPAGYDFKLFKDIGCPGGYRDRFLNDLLFVARKAGADIDEMYELAYHHWEHFAQPPAAEYPMPWSDAASKVPYVFNTVEPDPVPEIARRWAAAARSQAVKEGEVRTMGNVTVTGRHSWRPGAGR